MEQETLEIFQEKIADFKQKKKIIQSRIDIKTEEYHELIKSDKYELNNLFVEEGKIIKDFQKICKHPEIDYQHCKICGFKARWGHGC